ncbi:MAG: porin [Burkholderiales bacterium]|nr:porin [Burkholderiales bacterium]
MKKSLLALATLGLFAGAAAAQSTVTLFGIVDAGFARVSGGGKSNKGITNSGLNSSRLGFRGVEDLGGGLKAGFWLEGQLNNDTGDGATTGGALNFQRRSTLSLMGGFGEVRVGRDYTPVFLTIAGYEPFGVNGVGQTYAHTSTALVGGNTANAARANNSVQYFLPANLGGFNGSVMYAFGENDAVAVTPTTPGADKATGYFGFHVGYGAGPLGVRASYGKSEGGTNNADVKSTAIGVRYTFGAVTPMVLWQDEKTGAGVKVRTIELGVAAAFGQSEVRGSYKNYDVRNGALQNNDWKKLALGYGYNLSKRTQLYGTYARTTNDGASARAVANNGLATPAVAAGKSSTGYEAGIRHIF